jgi:hypothetical protein
MTRSTRAILLFVSVALGCGPGPVVDPPTRNRHYNFFEDYVLTVQTATLAGEQVPLFRNRRNEPCVLYEGLTVCVVTGWEAFTVLFDNESGVPVTLPWAAARYADESGQQHPVVVRGDPGKSPEVIPDGATMGFTVEAMGKRKPVSGEPGAAVLFEPLLPWNHSDGQDVAKQRVALMYQRGVPVTLTIPLKVRDEQKELAWRFVLGEQPSRVL